MDAFPRHGLAIPITAGDASLPEGAMSEKTMSGHELSRVIDFLRKIRQPFDSGLPGARPDPYWNVVLELVDSHLHQVPVTITTLIELSQASYGAGNRLITKMIEEGQIVKVPRGPQHKTVFLAPSDELLAAFLVYASRVKAHLARTFGLRSGAETEEYYFGGSYFAAHIIAPLQGHDINSAALRNTRFLLHDDNYFVSMRNMWSDFRNDIGRKSSFDLRPLPELYDRADRVLRDPSTAYDVVALNMPWLGRFADEGMLAPLDDVLRNAAINPLDFHPSVWNTGRWNGRQYGIPIYCTVEFLAARRDLFEEAGLSFPRSFDETIAAARALHRPDRGQYGIAWNAARGMPIAHSFMFFLASAGGAVIDIPRKHENWLDSLDPANPRLRIDSEEGLIAIDYMRRLAEVSPPEIETFDAERNLTCFMSGHAAMGYSWSMRAARLEHELGSRVKRRVAYLTPPVRKGRQVTAPVGGFLLTIPAYIDAERKREVVNAIAWMASPEAMKAHVQNGFPVAPRFSVCADPEALASSPIVSFVDRMARRHELNTWSRPPIPQYVAIEAALGSEIYAAVFEGKPPRQALAAVEAAVAGAFDGRGQPPLRPRAAE
jgi:multiple sugar transport system substrate-binding protein